MNVEKIFGTRVFDDSAMKKRLPQKVYQSLLRTRRLGQPLDPQIADVVACAMKEWALEQGATHYSHWFQPMNNFTAGKHDAFLTTNGGQGEIAMEFSSKALIQGEADSSSFPSGFFTQVSGSLFSSSRLGREKSPSLRENGCGCSCAAWKIINFSLKKNRLS